jgi:Bacterial PH domain
MNESPGTTVYRISTWPLIVVVFFSLLLPVFPLAAVADGDLTWPAGIAVSVAGLAVAGGLIWLAVRSATIVGPDRVDVRNLARTVRIPWSEIQDIRIERNPAWLATEAAPRELAVLYCRPGRRIQLSYVDDLNLGRHGRSLAAEVAELRTVWERRRGPDWAPATEVEALMADWQRYGNPWSGALGWGVAGALGAGAVVLIGLFAGAGDLPAPLSWLFQAEFIVVVPVVAFAVVTVAVLVRRTRERRRRLAIRAQ